MMTYNQARTECQDLLRRYNDLTRLIADDTTALEGLWARRPNLEIQIADLRAERDALRYQIKPPSLDVSVERDRRTGRQRIKPNGITMAAEFIGDNISHNVTLDRRRDALTAEIRVLREDWEKLNQDIRQRDDIRNRSYQGRATILNDMRRLECPGA